MAKAFQTIKAKQAPFISRGDRSGTNIAELKLWKDAGIDIDKDKGPWYKAIGQGIGTALNTAGASNAYVLSDRGTLIHFKNKGDLAIVVEGDKRMFNQYGVMLVNPEKHPNVKKDLGQQFIDFFNLAGRAEGHRQLQDQRRAVILPMPMTRVRNGRACFASRACGGGRRALRAEMRP